MLCPKCGYAMDAFDKECPRCHGESIQQGTPVAATQPTTPPTSTPSKTVAAPVLQNSAASQQNAESAKKLGACCGLGCGLPLLLLFALMIFGAMNGGEKNGYLPASGHIWTGVTIYNGTGETKNAAFEVLGGNDNYVDPYTGKKFRGLKVRFPNGSVEWKNRDAFIVGNVYWVKADDPALKRQRWDIYQY